MTAPRRFPAPRRVEESTGSFRIVDATGQALAYVYFKRQLQRLLFESHGIRFSEHLEYDGDTVFAHVCKMGLEGIVSKRRDAPYHSGRSRSWVKVRNPASPAMKQYEEGRF
jgi:ATP-dependent DNA ligase